MLIENAFFKLPELLISNFKQRGSIEATIVHLFGVALQMELNSRSIPLPFNHVSVEKPYSSWKFKGRPIRADLWFGVKTASRDRRLEAYGLREHNWIEVKAFLQTPSRSTPLKTANRGRLVRDLLRISVLPEELQGPIRQNGRYMLLVLDSQPSDYFCKLTSKTWLRSIFSEGRQHIGFNLKDEPGTVLENIGVGFVTSRNARVKMETHCYCFKPDPSTVLPTFWGYLIRIRSFDIKIGKLQIRYDDIPGDRWSQKRIQMLKKVRDEVIRRMGNLATE